MQTQEFVYARASSVSNVGEDIANSARHKRNQWRTLAEAEADGSAGEMVLRVHLMKNEPHKLLETITEENAMVHYAGYLIMMALPNKPYKDKQYTGYSKDLNRKHERSPEQFSPAPNQEEMRRQYFQVYMDLKARIEEKVTVVNSAGALCSNIHSWSHDRVEALRAGGHFYNPVGNTVIVLQNAVRGSFGASHSRGTILFKLAEVQKEIEAAKWSSEETLSRIKMLIEGKSLSKILGFKSQAKPKKFTDEDDYGLEVERIGGTQFGKFDGSMLVSTFGLRGLQFGNSLPDIERADHIQRAAEAFADLADILEWENTQIGIGNLGLAIGARGRSRALAHYEPKEHAINLTRVNGAGSLAHEWFHALDKRLGKMSELPNAFLSDSAAGVRYSMMNPKISEEIYTAMKDIFIAMKDSGYSYRLKESLWKMIRDKIIPSGKFSYWDSPCEKVARGMEMYVQYSLEQKGRKNTYLSGARFSDVRTNEEETKVIAPAYAALFKACRELTII